MIEAAQEGAVARHFAEVRAWRGSAAIASVHWPLAARAQETQPCRAADRAHQERWAGCPRPLQGRQHAGEDFEPKIVFVAQAVGETIARPLASVWIVRV